MMTLFSRRGVYKRTARFSAIFYQNIRIRIVCMAEGESGGGGYVQLPADCVTMCAESLGITQLAQDVVPALAEDVNYRVREATQVFSFHCMSILITFHLSSECHSVHATCQKEEADDR